jgi:hypothetical protein
MPRLLGPTDFDASGLRPAAVNRANDPPRGADLHAWYNVEAMLVWREDGYYPDWRLIPDTPLRVLEETEAFWDLVCPACCADCGQPLGPGPHWDESCLECRWSNPARIAREREDPIFSDYCPR